MAISRMKDFYDMWILSKQFAFDGASLSAAIAATFNRRNTPVPTGVPTALTDGFARDRGKQTQWTAFLARNGLSDAPPDLSGVVHDLRAFLLEPMQAASQHKALAISWKPGGPWA
jgi:hypothetical protein